MENASKALIIIGAILIALLLITAGVYVVNLMNEPQDQATDLVKSQSTEMFNSKFTGYAGEQRGSAIKQLITTIQSTNGTNTDHRITNVTVSGTNATTTGDDATKLSWMQAHTNNQKTYTVTFSYDAGYINGVTIDGTWKP